MAVRTRIMAWLGATLLLPELSHALTVGRLDVRSALGEPFRAELVVSDLGNVSASQIQAALANDSDFSQLGIQRNTYAGALSLSVRDDGNRAIVSIRSNQPLNEPFLEFVIKISAGDNVRLQHITALIDPPRRPTATAPDLAVDQNTKATPVPTATDTSVRSKKNAPVDVPLVPVLGAPPPLSMPSAEPAPVMTQSERASAPRYVVKPNDSLWKIASTLQKQRATSVGTLMTQIRQLNQDAFFKGDPNQLKKGATLVLPKAPSATVSLTQDAPDIEPPRITTPPVRKTTTTPPAVTPQLNRGALPRAELTLVAPTRQGMAQGNSVLTGRSSGVQPLSRDLATRVGIARRKTSVLRREITELDAQVTANDQKIAMQNAKLAELEQRLKARKEAKKRLIMTKTPVVALAAAGLLSSLLGMQPAHAAPAQAAANSGGSSMWIIIVVALLVVGGVVAFLKKGKSKPTPPPAVKADPKPASQARPVSRPVAVEPAPVTEAPKPVPVVEAPADPIVEAQAFISRERYPQAVGLLNKAIAAEPARSDLVLLLIDVYARQNDLEGFDEQFARLQTLNDSQAIAIARQLRDEIAPPAPVVAEVAPLAFTTSEPVVEPVALDLPSSLDARSDDNSNALDFSLEKPITDGHSPSLTLDQDDQRAFTLDTADAPALTTDTAVESLADLELEFRTSGVRPAVNVPAAEPVIADTLLTDLNFELPADKAPAIADDTPVKLDFDVEGSFDLADDLAIAKTESQDNFAAGFDDLDFSLPSEDQQKPVANTTTLSMTELDAASGSAMMDSQANQFDALLDQADLASSPVAYADTSSSTSVAGGLSEQLAAEFPFLAEQDDQQVNLDLARSYADLGELQSARELLANVMVNGTDSQQNDARQLLAKIAS